MPCSAVSPVPQGLELREVSAAYVCSLLLRRDFFGFQSSCLQRFSLPIVWSATGVRGAF